MKWIHLAGLLLLLPAVAAGQGITVDHVDGLDGTGRIMNGNSLTFHMRLTNTNDDTVHSIANGFWVYSDGMTWESVTWALNPAVCWAADQGCSPYLFDWRMFVDVFGDTVGFGAVAVSRCSSTWEGPQATGLVPGFDDIGYSITVGPISVQNGTFLTLDSCYYPPANHWAWQTCDVGEVPCNWGGPYTYRLPLYTFHHPMPIVLKDLESDVLEVRIINEDVDQVDLCSVRVNGKIPPYETECAQIDGTDIVTTCYIHRFLNEYQPLKQDYFGVYTVSYMKGGQEVTITGDVEVRIIP